MDLRDYLRIVRREWALILACVVLGVAAGVGLTLATTKLYRADVQLFVAADSATVDGGDTGLAQSNNFVQDRVQSYTSIATSPKVTKAVIKKYDIKSLTPQQLADKISSDAPPNKVLINLHVTDHSPVVAAKLANEVAAAFATVVQNTEQTSADGSSVVKLTVIHPATIPSSPVKPNRVLYIGLGFAAGLLLGLALVIIRDLLDTTVKGSADFDELGVPVLGMIPLDKRTPKLPIAFRADPHGTRAEAYRQLRTNLQFVNVDHAPRVIAVTSAVPGEGKSTTALNLAAALAEAGSRVCLIEADLRRPTIAATLGLVPEVGFTTVVIGKIAPQDALQNAGRNLAVLVCGPVPPNPSELLSSEHARDLIRALAEQVDYAIIDTAPLLPVADGAEVAALADATIVVHRAGKTSKDQVARSVQALERIGERPVGAVLNMVTRRTGRYDYEENYYYTYHPRRRRGAAAEPVPVEPEPTEIRPVDDAPAEVQPVPPVVITKAALAPEKTVEEPPVADEEHPATADEEHPATADEEHPATDDAPPVVEDAPPVADAAPPVAEDDSPVAEGGLPVVDDAAPAADEGFLPADDAPPAGDQAPLGVAAEPVDRADEIDRTDAIDRTEPELAEPDEPDEPAAPAAGPEPAASNGHPAERRAASDDAGQEAAGEDNGTADNATGNGTDPDEGSADKDDDFALIGGFRPELPPAGRSRRRNRRHRA